MNINKDTALYIEDLISQMKVEEKAGQMTQVTLIAILDQEDQVRKIDAKKLKEAIHEHGIGSFLNIGTQALERSDWKGIIGQIQQEAGKTRLKIPVLYGIDAIHGANYTKGSTFLPQPINQAATWNPALIKEAQRITAYEVAASGIRWNFSPVLDVGRQPLWPRFWETFGEDVYMTTVMGEATMQGYQGEDLSHPESVACCLKHFIGYSLPFSGKDRTPAYIAENTLREYFLPPFEKCIREGAYSVMLNSAEMNGIPVHANRKIITGLLKEELGFKGLVVSDWEDIKRLYHIHRIASSEKEATRIAISAGLDMSMVPFSFSFCEDLTALIREKEVTTERIDDAVRRILSFKAMLGLLKFEQKDQYDFPHFASIDFRKKSLEVALESITLLKNKEYTLPVSRSGRILVTGPNADSVKTLNGGWSYTWQGDAPADEIEGKHTITSALKNHLSEAQVLFIPFEEILKGDQGLAEAALHLDYIIVCLGEQPYTEKHGDINDLSLPQEQVRLCKELARYNKPLIYILTEGRPRLIHEIEPLANAILLAYLPGSEGGDAIARVVTGAYNPGGKLPFTYPRYPNSHITYDHKTSEEMDHLFLPGNFNPQYEFGHGLSYTSFFYYNLLVDKTTFTEEDVITINVTVTNTGNTAGSEVVQLYYRDQFASVTPSVKKLIRFQKVYLVPGDFAEVTFRLNVLDLSFIDGDCQRVIEEGDFDIMVGGLKHVISFRRNSE